MNDYCKRCAHNPCICVKRKPAPPPKPRPKPKPHCKTNPAKQLLMYYAYSEMECKTFPNTCSSWYRPYYGESKAMPIRYLLNHFCR